MVHYRQTIPFLAVMLLVASTALSQVTYPTRLTEGQFVSDNAALITPADNASIAATCAKLQAERGVPLIVVTIASLADHGAGGWPIERYAMNLYAEWGIGSAARNAGILLLVSKGDRKVRVELGAAYGRDRDAAAQAVVNQVIVPRFKAGQFSEGIRQGVEALAARIGPVTTTTGGAGPAAPAGASGPQPTAPAPARRSWGLGPFACLIIPVGLLIVVAIFRRFTRGTAAARGAGFGRGLGGRGGYGPYGWGGSRGGGLLPGLLLGWLGGRYLGGGSQGGGGGGLFGGGSLGGGSFGGGGFGGGGGSFGGGFSGGGGATGSW